MSRVLLEKLLSREACQVGLLPSFRHFWLPLLEVLFFLKQYWGLSPGPHPLTLGVSSAVEVVWEVISLCPSPKWDIRKGALSRAGSAFWVHVLPHLMLTGFLDQEA